MVSDVVVHGCAVEVDDDGQDRTDIYKMVCGAILAEIPAYQFFSTAVSSYDVMPSVPIICHGMVAKLNNLIFAVTFLKRNYRRPTLLRRIYNQ